MDPAFALKPSPFSAFNPWFFLRMKSTRSNISWKDEKMRLGC
jgi:hypothetical protein